MRSSHPDMLATLCCLDESTMKSSNQKDATSTRRRRWNSGSDVPNDAIGGKKNAPPGPRDLAEKMDQNCCGYPPSDTDDDNNGGGSAKAMNRIDRSTDTAIDSGNVDRFNGERRFGASRLAGRKGDGEGDCTTTNDDQKKSGALNNYMSLPTPMGWNHPSKKNPPSSVRNIFEETPAPTTRRRQSPRPPSTDVSRMSGFTLSSAPRRRDGHDTLHDRIGGATTDNSNNPYATRKSYNSTPASSGSSIRSSSTRKKTKSSMSKHVTIAISENLARETCVASVDAHRPTFLQIVKQGNGQTYSETLALLQMMNPDEILLNEGRRNSRLAMKIIEMFAAGGSGGRVDEGIVVGGASKKSKKTKKKDWKSVVGDRGRHSRFGGVRGGGNDGIDDEVSGPNAGGSGACEMTTVVKFVPRSYFDQTRGAELLRKLARGGTYDATIVEEYILLASSHAVLQYSQLCLGASLTRGSLTLDVNIGGNQRMSIDRSTMANLELLVNARTGKVANSLVGTVDCTKTSVGGRLLRTNLMAPPTRLDTINARLDLVDSLLDDEEFFYVVMEHLEDLPDVDKMLSYVALAPRGLRGSSSGALFGNVERQSVTAKTASKGISALVCIKSTLSVIPSFAHVLEVQLKELDGRETTSSSSSATARARQQNDRRDDDESTTIVESETSRNDDDSHPSDESKNSVDDAARTSLHMGMGRNDAVGVPNDNRTRHQLLQAILIAMKQPALSRVLTAVKDIFTESTTYSKNTHAMRHQECFALRPNTDGMMDVLRKAFLANIDDIYRLADEYAETYDITVQVKETTSRGYYLSVSADLGLDLPQIFIQPVKNGRFIHCTTEEVYSLNSRAQENVQDLLLMTHERIQEVLAIARQNYDSIASLSDAVALLDMCHCFADNVASSRLSWCRPVLSDHDKSPRNEDAFVGGGGAIAIRNGRYAIDVSSTGMNPSPTGEGFVPNDTYSSALQNFTVITGINGSGKSTYLKQIALIVILAHCGSYVPADEALLPIRDQICTRIGTSDDQEHNISTFLLEMKETAFICNSTTDRSLFLLDELGRATSNEDGVAIAWAVSEYLLTKRDMTYFVTHYPQLAKLAEVYPNVQNQHLGSQIIPSASDTDASIINYTHKILPGPCKSAGDYGVEMAATCGWPAEAVKDARRIREEVKRLMPGEDVCHNASSNENFAANRRNAHNILCDIAKHLAAMKEGEGRLSNDAKRNYLQELRDRLVPANDESLVRTIRNLLLNVDDAAPIIPLTRAKPTIDVRNANLSSTSKEDMVVPTETGRGLATSDNSNKAPEEGAMTANATNEWNCDFSTSDSDASMMEVGISTKIGVGIPSSPANKVATSQPIQGVKDARGNVETKAPRQKQDNELGSKSAVLSPLSAIDIVRQRSVNSIVQDGTSMTNSTSSSSSDDGSVSSTSSDGTSSSSSSSSSSSTR